MNAIGMQLREPMNYNRDWPDDGGWGLCQGNREESRE